MCGKVDALLHKSALGGQENAIVVCGKRTAAKLQIGDFGEVGCAGEVVCKMGQHCNSGYNLM